MSYNRGFGGHESPNSSIYVHYIGKAPREHEQTHSSHELKKSKISITHMKKINF